MVWCRHRENHYAAAPRARRHYRSPAAGAKNNKNKRLFLKQPACGGWVAMAVGDGEQLIWRRIIRLIKPRF